MSRAVIFCNGVLPDPTAAHRLLRADDFFVAADGGLRIAQELGIMPHVVVGDMDSVDPQALAEFVASGGAAMRYPAQKDQTDLELALTYVAKSGYGVVLILAALGGRFDQSLGNLSLLVNPVWQEMQICLDDGLERVSLVTGLLEMEGMPGDTVSLLPWGMPVEGVVTDGLRYPLRAEILFPFATRGISNEMISTQATVRVSKGVLICIHSRKGDVT